MKLADLNTDRALDVFCELTPYAANIMGDKKIIAALESAMPKKPEDASEGAESASSFSTGVQMMGSLANMAPILLKEHRPDVYGILSVMNECSVDQIAAQKLTETIKQLREVFRDTELLAFFRSSAQQGQTEPSAPSVPSPG